MSVRTVVREFTDGNGVVVRVRVDVDESEAFEREVLHLANKARSSRTRRATSAGGVLSVTVISEITAK